MNIGSMNGRAKIANQCNETENFPLQINKKLEFFFDSTDFDLYYSFISCILSKYGINSIGINSICTNVYSYFKSATEK